MSVLKPHSTKLLDSTLSGKALQVCHKLLQQSDELPCKEIQELPVEIAHRRNSDPFVAKKLTRKVIGPYKKNTKERLEQKKLWDGLPEKLKQLKLGRRKTNKESILPISSKDLTNKEKALNSKEFLRRVLDIPPKYHTILLLLCGSFLSYQVKNLTAPFESPLGNSGYPLQSQLSLGKAFDAFHPEMGHITKFILSYFLTLMLILPLHPGLQIFFTLCFIPAPLFYFPELARKASGVVVDCGSFQMPLIWFTTLGALCLSLICGISALLFGYISWIYIYKGKELEIVLDGSSEIMEN